MTLRDLKDNIEKTLTDKVHNLEEKLDEVSLQLHISIIVNIMT